MAITQAFASFLHACGETQLNSGQPAEVGSEKWNWIEAFVGKAPTMTFVS
jgi:hypothetical protein